ncbi:DUF5336 domain-containing protein [Mycolicibacterium pulveris]|uniref:DUF5336 domain-containing protein n=1 Tax=Mycolicibacterium pulveris TaxID=36813 RepID=UPI003CEF205C
MTYPPGPSGSPGYPPAHQPTTQFSAPTQQFGKVGEPASQTPEGPSRLPTYLTAAVAALGLAVYLASFGPLFTIAASDFPGLVDVSGGSFGLVLAVAAAVLAGLLAGVSLLPKQTVATSLVTVLSVLAFLLVIAEVINKPSVASIDWGLYLVIAFTVLQAIVAVAVLLFETGIVSAPTPRPKYDQSYGQYGGPGGPYYGHQYGGPQQQRPGYPTPYGGYPSGPSTGGFASPQPGSQPGSQQGAQQGSQSGSQSGGQSGPPTPPTGFPTYGQPPSNSNQTTQASTQPSSSSQSGQPPS